MSSDVTRTSVERAEKRLTSIRESMRAEGTPELKHYASEILQVVLTLREALE